MKLISISATVNNRNVEKEVSQLIFGTAEALTLEKQNRLSEMLEVYIEAGGNTLDTAHQYVGSEETLGKWLSKANNRERIQVMTKGAHPNDGEPGNRLKPDSIDKDILESLERLQSDYIDFFALHRDDPSVEVGPIVETLNKHIVAGRIHSIGVSNWQQGRIEQANEYAKQHGLVGFSFSSPNLSLAKCKEPRWEGAVTLDREGINWHKTTQLPLLSWSSQAGGFFSGRFNRHDLSNEDMVRVYYNEENWERYHRAKVLAEEKGVSPIQIALAYVLNHPFATAAIIGPENKEELLSSCNGSKVLLSDREVEWLDLINDEQLTITLK